jgi:ketosteroid isomerase-like protein
VAEDVIRQRVADYAKAISAMDLDAVMSFFAPDVVSFDLEQPLSYAGADNKRRRWQRDFAMFSHIDYEVRDLSVTSSGDLAIVHALNRLTGTMTSGRVTGSWVRWTACLRRVAGVWLVAHDHVSVPVEIKEGKALLSLTP